MSEIKKIFEKTEAISTKDGDYILYEDGDKDFVEYYGTAYAIYLFLPTEGKDFSKLNVLAGFSGINCLCYSSGCFGYYEGATDGNDLHISMPKGLPAGNKLKWIASNKLHLYLKLAENKIEINEEALMKFFEKAGIL